MKPILDIKNAALEFIPFFEALSCEDGAGYYDSPLGFQPRFNQCAKNLDESLFIADIHRCITSIIKPGDNEILTCSCGRGDDVGIDIPVFVAHPDKNTIVWELDAEIYYFLFENIQKQNGFIRISFARDVYVAAAKAALHKAREILKQPLPAEDYCAYQLKDNIALKLNNILDLPILIDCMMPDNMEINEFYMTELQRDWNPIPLFKPNTKLEIGVFANDVVRSKSSCEFISLYGYFTRWETWKAYNHWWETLEWVSEKTTPAHTQAFHTSQSSIILKKGYRAEDSHERGRIFAEAYTAMLAQDSFCDKNISAQYIVMPLIERE